VNQTLPVAAFLHATLPSSQPDRIAMPLRIVSRALCVAAAAIVCAGAHSQDYPLKPVRIIVPFAPGGGTDLSARIIAQKLGENLAANFLVDNRPGAAGIVGTEMVARSKADGYALLVVSSSHAINPAMYPKLPYDTAHDFAPVSLLLSGPALLVAHPSLPARNAKELIALAKARPGMLTFASAGHGTPPHMGGELFKSLAGIDITHIPYKGNGPAYTDLMAGQVSIMFPNIATAIQYVKTNRMRALGVGSRQRSAIAPEIPTIAESGLPGYEMSSWFGLLAPAGTPAAIVMRLQQEIARIFKQAEVREKLLAQGVEPVGGTPQEFAAFLNNETALWAKVIRSSGLKPE
jgi:tripartite-type tricarboxylate transporter receptor subunit TctC